jgi:DedD protein
METARQFLLQMGVFSSVANAEELRARLELAGVPTQIEARVQVGPFASRQEAEQARDKLKELGLEPGLVVAARK